MKKMKKKKNVGKKEIKGREGKEKEKGREGKARKGKERQGKGDGGNTKSVAKKKKKQKTKGKEKREKNPEEEGIGEQIIIVTTSTSLMHSRRILAAGQGRDWENRGSRPRSAQPRGLAWGSALGFGFLCQPRLRVIRYGDLRLALCGHLPANPNTEITHGEILRNKTISRPPPARSQQDFFPSFSLSSSFFLVLNPPSSPI